MAINHKLIEDLRGQLERELPEQYLTILIEYNEAVAKPNYRAAFMSLMKTNKIQGWHPSEILQQLIGRFWHEVAE